MVSTVAACIFAVTINSAITASTQNYLKEAQQKAQAQSCQALLVKINTPGGSLQSTRLIVEDILASPLPYYCLISPDGGHAGSAGAIILQACHKNGGLKATNLGAATPVLGQGGSMSEDLRKKMINDTVSWLESIAKVRGRSTQFAKDIVTEAKAVTAAEAQRLGALDFVVNSEAEFLQKLGLEKAPVVDYAPAFKYKVFDFIADPEFSYLIFMGSLGLLYLEISNPGLIVPGVLGSMGLILSLVAFHKLEVMWGGLALILLGVLLLALEVFITSFGVLAVGGIVALFLGSMFLFDPSVSGFSLSLSVIIPVVGTLAALLLALGYMTMKSFRFKSKDADSELQMSEGTVYSVQNNGQQGQVQILGEFWNFVSSQPLQVGDKVKVIERQQGLTLQVERK